VPPSASEVKKLAGSMNTAMPIEARTFTTIAQQKYTKKSFVGVLELTAHML